MCTNVLSFESKSANADKTWVSLVVGADDKDISIAANCDNVANAVDAMEELLNDLFSGNPLFLTMVLERFPRTYNAIRDYFMNCTTRPLRPIVRVRAPKSYLQDEDIYDMPVCFNDFLDDDEEREPYIPDCDEEEF